MYWSMNQRDVELIKGMQKSIINLDQGIRAVKGFLITSCHGTGIKLALVVYNRHNDSISLLLLDSFFHLKICSLRPILLITSDFNLGY